MAYLPVLAEEVQDVQLAEPKLLIADDDRDFRESLGEVFERRGYGIRLAADGQEAVEIAQSLSPLHLVLFDVHMPRKTGLQALCELRQAELLLPCILMSAKLDDAIVKQADELETCGVLAKPFTLRDLTTTVERVLLQVYGGGEQPL
ncbi:MAG: response regulator [Aureliella sp.]